jgi:hypothetical protein
LKSLNLVEGPQDAPDRLTTDDMQYLRGIVQLEDIGWEFKIERERPTTRQMGGHVILMYWASPTDFLRPTIMVKATRTGFMVTVFTFWRHINHVKQEQTYYSGLEGVAGKLAMIARAVSLAARQNYSPQGNSLEKLRGKALN